jgi:hypothetical protein
LPDDLINPSIFATDFSEALTSRVRNAARVGHIRWFPFVDP